MSSIKDKHLFNNILSHDLWIPVKNEVKAHNTGLHVNNLIKIPIFNCKPWIKNYYLAKIHKTQYLYFYIQLENFIINYKFWNIPKNTVFFHWMHTYSNSKAFEIFSKKNNLLILPREYTPGVFTNYYLLQHKFLENYAKNSLNFDNLRITSLLNDFDRQSLTIKPSLYFFFHVGQEDPVYKETLGGGSPIIRFSSLICSTQDDLYIATSCYSYKEFLNNYLSQSFCNLKNKYVHNFSSKSQTYLFKKQHTASFYTFFYKWFQGYYSARRRGNKFYQNTLFRFQFLKKKKIRYPIIHHLIPNTETIELFEFNTPYLNWFKLRMLTEKQFLYFSKLQFVPFFPEKRVKYNYFKYYKYRPGWSRSYKLIESINFCKIFQTLKDITNATRMVIPKIYRNNLYLRNNTSFFFIGLKCKNVKAFCGPNLNLWTRNTLVKKRKNLHKYVNNKRFFKYLFWFYKLEKISLFTRIRLFRIGKNNSLLPTKLLTSSRDFTQYWFFYSYWQKSFNEYKNIPFSKVVSKFYFDHLEYFSLSNIANNNNNQNTRIYIGPKLFSLFWITFSPQNNVRELNWLLDNIPIKWFLELKRVQKSKRRLKDFDNIILWIQMKFLKNNMPHLVKNYQKLFLRSSHDFVKYSNFLVTRKRLKVTNTPDILGKTIKLLTKKQQSIIFKSINYFSFIEKKLKDNIKKLKKSHTISYYKWNLLNFFFTRVPTKSPQSKNKIFLRKKKINIRRVAEWFIATAC